LSLNFEFKFELIFSKAMKLGKSIVHFAIISASIVAASLPVRTAIVTYADRHAFLPLCPVRLLTTRMICRQALYLPRFRQDAVRLPLSGLVFAVAFAAGGQHRSQRWNHRVTSDKAGLISAL
jgi:hypothetical protein